MNHQFMKNNDSQSHTARWFLIDVLKSDKKKKCERSILQKLSTGNKAQKANNSGQNIQYYHLQKTKYLQWKEGGDQSWPSIDTGGTSDHFPRKKPARHTNRSRINKQLETVCSRLVWVFPVTAGVGDRTDCIMPRRRKKREREKRVAMWGLSDHIHAAHQKSEAENVHFHHLSVVCWGELHFVVVFDCNRKIVSVVCVYVCVCACVCACVCVH